MADKCVVNKSTMTDIANAIRAKGGTTDTMLPSEMASAIEALPSGGAEEPETMWEWDAEKATETIYVIDLERDGMTIIPFKGILLAKGHTSYTIDWGDGTSTTSSYVRSIGSDISSFTIPPDLFHTYTKKGRYVIRISNDISLLYIGGDYNESWLVTQYGNRATFEGFLTLCSSVKRIVQVGNLLTNLGTNANGASFIGWLNLTDLCATPPSATLGLLGASYNSISRASIISNTLTVVNYANLSVIGKALYHLRVPNLPSFTAGGNNLYFLPQTLQIKDGATVTFNTYRILRDTLAKFDSNGNIIGGMAFGAYEGAYIVKFARTSIKASFDSTTVMPNGLTEVEAIEKAFTDKGITLIW